MYSRDPARFTQGAIVRNVLFTVTDSSEYGFLLTPECDLEQEKAETVVFVAVFDALLLFQDFARGIAGLTETSGAFVANPRDGSGRLRDKISDIQNQRVQRYHWLQPLPGTDMPLVADFQYLSCLSTDSARTLSVIANIVDPVRAAVATRYAAYVGRIGVDDPDKDAQKAWLDSAFTRTFSSG